MHIVDVIGVGLDFADLTQKHHRIIEGGDILVGGKRHLGWFPAFSGEKREITSPVEAVIGDIRRWMNTRRVVVLASGDPLFFGIGESLVSRLGTENVQVHPNVSVMAAAFARIGRTWKDAAAVSLHGRGDDGKIAAALAGNRPVFVYTDGNNTPDKVARTAFANAPAGLRVCVLERLGQEDERIRWIQGTGDEADFAEPNAVILLPDAEKEGGTQHRIHGFSPVSPPAGTSDDLYAHDAGMITKSEVRAVSISKLRLKPHHVMWDLGAGSGAVAIEASTALTSGRVAAVEKNRKRISNIRKNIRRFNAANVDIHHLALPEGNDDLPDPDRVFIGGGGKDLPEIIRMAAKRLKTGGRMVINAVVLETVAAALKALEEDGFDAETACVQVSRGEKMPSGIRFCAINPVFVISAKKPGDRDTKAGRQSDNKRFPVLFVGAGPGDPELITIKGQKTLQEADNVLYAGSLVPDAVMAWTNSAAELKSSAGMHLNEIIDYMADAQENGKRVVRLHSGDPSLYGAIAEQMNALEKMDIPFAVIPGVTAAFAAASALGIEYTVPEKTQTLILTRAEGRTLVPDSEKLQKLAAHGAAMAVYLSAGLAENVEKDLSAAYGPDAPVAVVQRASRPDEKIIRTTAGRLSSAMAENGITATALILAGPALGENRGLRAASKLYDRSFSHGCRKGDT